MKKIQEYAIYMIRADIVKDSILDSKYDNILLNIFYF